MISGEERWSKVIDCAVEDIVMEGVMIIVEIGVMIKRVSEEWRHAVGDMSSGVRITGRRIFSIC